jgi:hypothetical protein
MTPWPDVGELAAFFLRLGCTAFGGPAAHIALMRKEAVERRRWLEPEAFLDLLGACNLIPGPSSTQMAMAIGHRRAGWKGLVVGGTCFILPAAALTLAIAWAYVRFGYLPQGQALLYGLKPAILAIVFQASGRWPEPDPLILVGGGRTSARGDPMSLATIQEQLQRLEILGGTAELEAIGLVLSERIRQIDGEGWTPSHDDIERREGQLAAAGASYALAVHQKALVHAHTGSLDVKPSAPHPRWPFHPLAWKPAGIRRMTVKSAALVLAELARQVRGGLA